MRALVHDTGRSFVDPDRPAPEPGEGEALLKPTRVAIGSADRAAASGRLRFSGVLGHQCVAVVQRVRPAGGRDHEASWVGKRVVVNPVEACGVCVRCKGGLGAHCPSRRVLGLHGRDGCFAELFTARVAALCEVPKAIDDDRAVFAVAAAAACHTIGACRFEGKTYVTVLGDGPIGLLCAQLAARRNASVRVLGQRPERLALCEKWGVKHRPLTEVGLRQDQDIVIDCTGDPAGLGVALGMVRPRGKVLLKTSPAPVPVSALAPGAADGAIDLASAVINEIEIVGVSGGGVSEGLDAIARGLVDVLPMRQTGMLSVMTPEQLLAGVPTRLAA